MSAAIACAITVETYLKRCHYKHLYQHLIFVVSDEVLSLQTDVASLFFSRLEGPVGVYQLSPLWETSTRNVTEAG